MATSSNRIFKPYYLYELEGVHYWLCKCECKENECYINNKAIGCCEKQCNNWGHISCYGLNDYKGRMEEYKHKCFKCRTKRTGRPRRWDDKDEETLTKMISNGSSFIEIALKLQRSVNVVQKHWQELPRNKNIKNQSHVQNIEIEAKKYICQTCNKSFDSGSSLRGHNLHHARYSHRNNSVTNVDNGNINEDTKYIPCANSNSYDGRENNIVDDDFNEDKNDYEEYNHLFLEAQQIQSLKINDKFDHKDKQGRFLPAKIVQIEGSKIFIHYEHYSNSYDIWIDLSVSENTMKCFSKYKSISNRKNSIFAELKICDSVNVRIKDNKWECCKIIQMDHKRLNGKSDQIKVRYNDGKKYWYHPDDIENVKLIENKVESVSLISKKKRARNIVKDKEIIPNKKKRKLNKKVMSVNDVLAWFYEIGYGHYVEMIKSHFEEEEVDGKCLKVLDLQDLKNYGIKSLYDRKMILEEIKKL